LHMIWQQHVRRARKFDAKAEYRIHEVFGDGRTGLHRAYTYTHAYKKAVQTSEHACLRE